MQGVARVGVYVESMCVTKKARINHETKLIPGQEKNKREEGRPELHRGQGSTEQGEPEGEPEALWLLKTHPQELRLARLREKPRTSRLDIEEKH